MNNEILEIKDILESIRTSVEKLLRIELKRIDTEMNNLLKIVYEDKTIDENYKKELLAKVDKYHKRYIELTLALYDVVDKSKYEHDDIDELAIIF